MLSRRAIRSVPTPKNLHVLVEVTEPWVDWKMRFWDEGSQVLMPLVEYVKLRRQMGKRVSFIRRPLVKDSAWLGGVQRTFWRPPECSEKLAEIAEHRRRLRVEAAEILAKPKRTYEAVPPKILTTGCGGCGAKRRRLAELRKRQRHAS